MQDEEDNLTQSEKVMKKKMKQTKKDRMDESKGEKKHMKKMKKDKKDESHGMKKAMKKDRELDSVEDFKKSKGYQL